MRSISAALFAISVSRLEAQTDAAGRANVVQPHHALDKRHVGVAYAAAETLRRAGSFKSHTSMDREASLRGVELGCRPPTSPRLVNWRPSRFLAKPFDLNELVDSVEQLTAV
jgi:hypothetical protein